MKRVFMVAGEASADEHAAAILKELKVSHPECSFFGIGGRRMKQEGFDALVDASQISVVGFTEILSQLGSLLSAFISVRSYLKKNPPDLAVLIDLPDMNLMFAKILHRLGVPIVYFISPQVWAWRASRTQKLKKYVSKMLVIFPFEKKIYDEIHLEAAFVGHPLCDKMVWKETVRSQLEIVRAPRIALLPGSRRSEVDYHARELCHFVEVLLSQYPDAQFQVPVASTLSLKWVKQRLSHPRIKLLQTSSDEVLDWADMAHIASGTASLEGVLKGVPLSIFYKASASTAWVFKRFVHTGRLFGMANILLGKEVFREFGQENFTVKNLFGETVKLIENETYRNELRAAARKCRTLLQKPATEPSVPSAVAFEISKFLNLPQPGL